jgi:hypothetical protein
MPGQTLKPKTRRIVSNKAEEMVHKPRNRVEFRIPEMLSTTPFDNLNLELIARTGLFAAAFSNKTGDGPYQARLAQTRLS